MFRYWVTQADPKLYFTYCKITNDLTRKYKLVFGEQIQVKGPKNRLYFEDEIVDAILFVNKLCCLISQSKWKFDQNGTQKCSQPNISKATNTMCNKAEEALAQA